MSTMKLKGTAGVAGKYKLRTGRRDTNGNEITTYDSGWFDNIITDAGLNLMGSDGYLNACQVGSGSAAPSAGNTSLVSFVAGTTTITNVVSAAQASAPYYGSLTLTFRFAEGDAAGNLSEVGIGTAATGGTLFSRALITDSGGSPTTITVLANEFLDVTYQLQLVPPTTDSTFNVTDAGPAGTVHAVTLRASEVTSTDSGAGIGWSPRQAGTGTGAIELATGTGVRVYNNVIGAITESPTGTADNVTSIVNDAYVNNSLEKTATATFGLPDGNLSGSIKSLRFQFYSAGTWQAEFNPVIPKTNTETLTLDLEVSWTRTTAL